MLDLNPAGVDLVYLLPADWRARLLNFQPSGVLAPLVRELQDVVQHHGDAAIAIGAIQEFALMACGLTQQPRFRAYEHVFQMLNAAAGAEWPITTALYEQRLAEKPIFDAAQRLIACDGEWLVLRALIQAEWIPKSVSGRAARDWTVAKGESDLPIEVKTKQSEGSDLGRLRFALRGLAMIPDGRFLNTFQWHWNGGLELTRKYAAGYFDLLSRNLTRIEQALARSSPLYEPVEVASSSDVRIVVQRFDVEKFGVDFEVADQSVSSDIRARNSLTLVAEPNRHPKFMAIGAVDAHFLREPDIEMLNELEQYVLNRLGIQRQASKRATDTTVVVVWEVPFHWKIDPSEVKQRWIDWSTTAGVVNGILIPLRAFEPPLSLLTPSAEKNFPAGLNLMG